MFLFGGNTRSNNSVGCLIMGVVVVVLGFFLLRGLYTILMWVAPVLLVLALVIRWQVFPATFRNWLKTMKTNPLSGIIQVAFAVLAFPLFALYMFLLAAGGRKMEQLQDQFRTRNTTAPEEEFADFEEIESRPKRILRTEEPLEPPVILREEPKPPRPNEEKKLDNPYDQLFK